MSKVKKKRRPPVPAKFAVRDKVRVKRGVKDVDYPDMPLGGWIGTICKIHKNHMYTVRWTQETLDAIQPVFKKRCERDSTDFEEYCLAEDDLEPDSGGPLDIEQPTKIAEESNSLDEQKDRIRTVFELSSNEPLPGVDDDTLLAFYEYLAENLSFPFEAEHTPESGTLFPSTYLVKVIRLDDADDEPMIDETYGILCETRQGRRVVTLPLGQLGVKKGRPYRQLIADYCDWFGNCR
ncbi:MAG: hypothetical protein H8E44_40185 [Planctomycetes bacterium]|nr:hypothetical protein [Planctomycetota bacterium]